MVSTIDLMAEHQVESGLVGALLDEEIAYLYTGIRLKPIYGKLKITKSEFDTLCIDIVNQYLNNDYSLDCMINAVYNYINKENDYPASVTLNDGIESFLLNYCKSIEDFTKRK